MLLLKKKRDKLEHLSLVYLGLQIPFMREVFVCWFVFYSCSFKSVPSLSTAKPWGLSDLAPSSRPQPLPKNDTPRTLCQSGLLFWFSFIFSFPVYPALTLSILSVKNKQKTFLKKCSSSLNVVLPRSPMYKTDVQMFYWTWVEILDTPSAGFTAPSSREAAVPSRQGRWAPCP